MVTICQIFSLFVIYIYVYICYLQTCNNMKRIYIYIYIYCSLFYFLWTRLNGKISSISHQLYFMFKVLFSNPSNICSISWHLIFYQIMGRKDATSIGKENISGMQKRASPFQPIMESCIFSITWQLYLYLVMGKMRFYLIRKPLIHGFYVHVFMCINTCILCFLMYFISCNLCI